MVRFARNHRPFSPSITSPGPWLQVLFGTADGQVIVMDCHGRMLAHVLLHESDGILSMSWNYPAFLVEDSSESDTDSDDYSPPQGSSRAPWGRECGRRTNPSAGEGTGPPCARLPHLLGRALNGSARQNWPNLCSWLDRLLSAIPFCRITGQVDEAPLA